MDFNYGVPFGGKIADMISSFFNPGDAYDEARKAFERYFNQAKEMQQPFVNAGQNQLPFLMGAEENLFNPENLINRFLSKYETSPYAKQLMNQAKDVGLQDASAQGLLGSSAALSNVQNSASNIMNRDRENYLSRLLNTYLQGVGLGENIYSTGASSASDLARSTIGAGSTIGGLRYNQAQAPGNLLERLLNMAMKGATAFGGGGLGAMGGGGFGNLASGAAMGAAA